MLRGFRIFKFNLQIICSFLMFKLLTLCGIFCGALYGNSLRLAGGSFSCVAVGDQGVVKGGGLGTLCGVGVLLVFWWVVGCWGGGLFGSLNLARPTYHKGKIGA